MWTNRQFKLVRSNISWLINLIIHFVYYHILLGCVSIVNNINRLNCYFLINRQCCIYCFSIISTAVVVACLKSIAARLPFSTIKTKCLLTPFCSRRHCLLFSSASHVCYKKQTQKRETFFTKAMRSVDTWFSTMSPRNGPAMAA